jgi:enoyl-[acyl-carrier-protein] reductase (NADH)
MLQAIAKITAAPQVDTAVADAAIFLLSSAARGVTGEILMVDSGFHAMGGA